MLYDSFPLTVRHLIIMNFISIDFIKIRPFLQESGKEIAQLYHGPKLEKKVGHPRRRQLGDFGAKLFFFGFLFALFFVKPFVNF